MKKIFKFIIIILIIFFIIELIKNNKNNKISNLLKKDYTEKYYINELYKSKELNYRLELNKKEKNLYDIFIKNLLNFNNSFKIDLSDYKFEYDYEYFNEIKKIINAVITDHPEIIYFGYTKVSKEKNSSVVNIKIEYVMSKDEYLKNIKYIKKEIDKIKIKTNNMSDYDKTKYVYEYLGKKNNYGNVKDSMSQSAYSAFNDELSPVCSGYSRASQLIFSNIKITSILMSGNLKSSWLTGDSHEWNIVKIDNQYYIYDVTQSSILKNITSNILYIGFLNQNKNLYSSNYKKVNPIINGKKYNYYKLNNLTYNYNKKNLHELKKLLNNKYTELKMNNINNFKNDFNNIKKGLNLKKYYIIDDIIVLEKN